MPWGGIEASPDWGGRGTPQGGGSGVRWLGKLSHSPRCSPRPGPGVPPQSPTLMGWQVPSSVAPAPLSPPSAPLCPPAWVPPSPGGSRGKHWGRKSPDTRVRSPPRNHAGVRPLEPGSPGLGWGGATCTQHPQGRCELGGCRVGDPLERGSLTHRVPAVGVPMVDITPHHPRTPPPRWPPAPVALTPGPTWPLAGAAEPGWVRAPVLSQGLRPRRA